MLKLLITEFFSDILHQYFRSGFFGNSIEMAKTALYENDDDLRQDTIKSILYLINIFSELSKKYNKPLYDIMALLMDVQDNDFLEKYGVGSHLLIYDENEDFYNKILLGNKNFVLELKEKLINYYEELFREAKDFIIYKLLVCSICNWNSLHTNLYEDGKVTKLKCFVVSNLALNHSYVIKEKLKMILKFIGLFNL